MTIYFLGSVVLGPGRLYSNWSKSTLKTRSIRKWEIGSCPSALLGCGALPARERPEGGAKTAGPFIDSKQPNLRGRFGRGFRTTGSGQVANLMTRLG